MKSYLPFRTSLMMTLISISSAVIIQAQVSHDVTVASNSFTPQNLEINVGDTVIWTNTQGSHNVNGTRATYPGNPVSFGNDVGAGWTYTFVFTQSGTYDYQCDPHASMGMKGKVIVSESNPGSTDVSVTLSFTGMNPHIGQKLVAYFVENDDDKYVDTITIEELTDPDFEIISEHLDSGDSYRIDFFADHNGNGVYDSPPADHAWRIDLGVVDGDTVVTFAHNTDFTDIFETPTVIRQHDYMDLKLFPNPAAEFIRLTGKNIPSGRLDIRILSVTGKLVKSMTINNIDNNLIDLTGLSNGAYFMLVESKGFSARAKFIKAR